MFIVHTHKKDRNIEFGKNAVDAFVHTLAITSPVIGIFIDIKVQISVTILN
jgi:hypothetical protein